MWVCVWSHFVFNVPNHVTKPCDQPVGFSLFSTVINDEWMIRARHWSPSLLMTSHQTGYQNWMFLQISLQMFRWCKQKLWIINVFLMMCGWTSVLQCVCVCLRTWFWGSEVQNQVSVFRQTHLWVTSSRWSCRACAGVPVRLVLRWLAACPPPAGGVDRWWPANGAGRRGHTTPAVVTSQCRSSGHQRRAGPRPHTLCSLSHLRRAERQVVEQLIGSLRQSVKVLSLPAANQKLQTW